MDSRVRPVSLGIAIRRAWAGFKDNLWFYLLSIFTYSVIHFLVAQYLGDWFLKHLPQQPASPYRENIAGFSPFVSEILPHLVGIGYILFGVWFLLGLIKASIEVMRGGKASFAHFLQSPTNIFRALGGYLLYFLLLLAGIILLVFPAIIWGVQYSLFAYFIADKSLSPVQSLFYSSETTKGAKWDLLGSYLVIELLWVAAVLTLGLGFFIVAPLWALIKAYFYVDLTKDHA